MGDDVNREQETVNTSAPPNAAAFGVAIGLAALAAVGAGIALQRLLEQRLSRREVARLRFYRYLRERGHLES